MIVHLYIAKKSNPNWLGEATVDQIANQVGFDYQSEAETI